METIVAIEEYRGPQPNGYGQEAGFIIKTNKQDIVLAIDDESCCCESWGYFLTEDDTSKFIGRKLLGIEVTDLNRSGREIATGYGGGRDAICLYDGDVMFVDIRTSIGILQFVAYNSHNGYYGHSARVSSTQLDHSTYL